MKKIIPLSLVALSLVNASTIELDSIGVESTYITEVSQNAQTSADLSDALSDNIPSIDMNRRSGISNDVYIRGQKRDNISVEVDGTKTCGACPNRMDPPVSHVLASQIEDIEVIEGPYDVETFGTMSGGIKITTKKPSQKLKGEIEFGVGSFGYTKVGATVSGGNDSVRVLLSGSTEKGEQYEDGNGDTLAQQSAKNATLGGNKYQSKYSKMDAYQKDSIMAKAYIKTLENHELRLSATANRSSDVLYPNTPMDAIRDDSDIYSVEYVVKNISDIYKNVSLQYFKSTVDHPMSTEYRASAVATPPVNVTNHMYSEVSGLKLKNSFNIADANIMLGLDSSSRVWEGRYYVNNAALTPKGASIHETTTTNNALFAKATKDFGDIELKAGLRYDLSEIKTQDPTGKTEDYNSLNLNIFSTYSLNRDNKIFLGVGQASRVPDARELYFISKGKQLGTPTLKKTTNTQIDVGYELTSDSVDFKVKAFYSMLEDFIYFKKNNPTNKFVNIDATIYGAEIATSYYVNDELTIDGSLSYKVGEKDKALAGQSDKDLADIAPLRAKIGSKYEYMADSYALLEVQFSDKWSNYDSDNGEQALDSWSVLNFKLRHTFNKEFELTFGVNNILDETYAQSNTYSDITLIAGSGDAMLLNDIGRYIYSNIKYKF